MDIVTTITDLGLMDECAAQLPGATEAGLDKGIQILYQGKQRAKQPTYSRPVPRDKKGNPKYPRSGDYISGDVIASEPGKRVIQMTGNAVNYEEVLANLPVSKDGVNRRNNSAQDAVDLHGEKAIAAIEQEVFGALGLS